jgi:alkylation response protein AidB-like acyl-CoA dehydrogenase
MDFSRTDEQKAIQDLVKKIFREEVSEESLKAMEAQSLWHHDGAWNALRDSGLLGVCLPERYGGAGLSFFDLCLVLEQLGRNVVPLPLFSTVVLGALPINEFGTDQQKEDLLPGICDGRHFITAALQEPNSLQVLEPETQAKRGPDGWVLNGEKHCVPGFQGAKKILVSARTGADTTAIFLVDPDADGITASAQRSIRKEPLHHLNLNGVQVSNEAYLGSPDENRDALRWTYERACAALCAVHLGVARQALVLTAQYTAERHQFGVPIASFQAVHQRAADAYIDVQSMELTMWQAAWALANGREASRETAIARFWSSEAGHRVVCAAQHLHGGMGYDCDYPLHRFFRWSKHLELQLGGPQTQLSRMGRTYLGD